MKHFLCLLPFGLSLLFSRTESLYEGLATRSSNIRTSPNSRLCGYVISSQRTLNIFGCAHRCLSDQQCASFNFFEQLANNDGICELNSADSFYNNKKPREADGWTFGFIEGKNWPLTIGGLVFYFR